MDHGANASGPVEGGCLHPVHSRHELPLKELVARGRVTVGMPSKVMTIAPLVHPHCDAEEVAGAVRWTVRVSADAPIPVAVIPPRLCCAQPERRQ